MDGQAHGAGRATTTTKRLWIAVIALAAGGCQCGETGTQDLGKPPGEALDERLVPPGATRLGAPALDSSVLILASIKQTTLVPGKTWDVKLAFMAPNANVSGLGVRFGDGRAVNVFSSSTALGQIEGVLEQAFQLPPTLCNGLGTAEPDPERTQNWTWQPAAEIACHRLKAELFAVTSDGRVSQGYPLELGIKCNDCGEPTCAAILAECRPCIAGDWVGRYEAGLGGGDLVVHMEQNGQQISGTVTVPDGQCRAGGAISGGRIADNMLSLGAVAGGEGTSAITFEGRADLDCKRLTGEFALSGGTCGDTQGEWFLERCDEPPAQSGAAAGEGTGPTDPTDRGGGGLRAQGLGDEGGTANRALCPGAPQQADAGVALRGCRGDFDCSSGRTCLPDGTCGMATDCGCAPGSYCLNGACTPCNCPERSTCDSTGACTPVAPSADAGAMIQPPDGGGAQDLCASDIDCPFDLKCDLSSRSCEPCDPQAGECFIPEDCGPVCPAGRTCACMAPQAGMHCGFCSTM